MQVPVWDNRSGLPARDTWGRFVTEANRTQWPNLTYDEAVSLRFSFRPFSIRAIALLRQTRDVRALGRSVRLVAGVHNILRGVRAKSKTRQMARRCIAGGLFLVDLSRQSRIIHFTLNCIE